MTQAEIDFFDRLASGWDDNEVRSTPERVRSILSKIPLRKGMRVLDLGTGTGVLVPYLSELVGEKGEVVGIDLSEGMLARAESKFGKLPNVKFLKIDFEEEVIPGKYDVVFLYSVYPHLHFPKDTIDWLFRMNLDDEGMIVIAFPSDENFINNIHHERNSASNHLPPAGVLAGIIRGWGYVAEVLADDTEEYIILITRE